MSCRAAATVDSGTAIGDAPTRSSRPTAVPAPSAALPPIVTETPVTPPTPTATPVTPPAVTETPAVTPPTATEIPTPPDNSPVMIEGDGWAITDNEIAAMAAFIEEIHGLEFTEPVAVGTRADIGAEFAIGFEPVSVREWNVMDALGLLGDAPSRSEVNQLRLDRIRGVCCSLDPVPTVVVEIQASELATSMIIVHELVHALHVQVLGQGRRDLSPSGEVPLPATAAIEGVPQYVAIAYMDTRPDLVATAELFADLPIIPDDLVSRSGAAPAELLNFIYGTGPTFVEAVVAELGTDGLAELIRNPPQTNEQVLFPEVYLSGEDASPIESPPLEAEVTASGEGRLGVAVLAIALDESDEGLLALWAGDAYTIYRRASDEALCIDAAIQLDTEAAAGALAEALGTSLAMGDADEVELTVSGVEIALQSCRIDS